MAAATASRPALFHTMLPSPRRVTNTPEASVPAMNAAEPAARTQPYGKPRPACDEPSASASASGVSGASTAACATLTSISSGRPRAGT